LYEKVLNLLGEDDFSRRGEIHERLGCAFYRAAFQTESNDEFKEGLHRAIQSHQQAKEFYGRLDEPLKRPRTLRCDAMTTLMGYWLAEKASEKKKLLDECWKLTKDALEAFEAGNAMDYGKTFNELSASIDLGYYFHETFQTREKIIREAAEYGEHAIKYLSTLGNHLELARAYSKTAVYTSLTCDFFANLDDREKYSQKATDYWLKAKDISEETAMLELPSVLFGCGPAGYWGDGTDNALNNFERALDCSRKTRDRFIIGRALDLLVYHSGWRAEVTEDPDEKAALLKKALQYAEDAEHQYSAISFTSPRGGAWRTEGAILWHYSGLANRETDLNRKRELLGKTLEVALDILKRAENSGYPDYAEEVHGIFARVLRELAKLEANPEEKKRLLETALMHNEESVAISEQIEPLAYWNLGLIRGGTIVTRHELADLTKEPETKKNMLRKILLDSQDALGFCIKGLTSYKGEAATPMLGTIAYWEVYNGNLLYSLHELTSDKEYLTRAIEAFQRGIETYQKTNQTSRLAESFWKIAQTYDALGEHMKAGDNFDQASKSYRNAAERIPQLKDFYRDHASYMEAWNAIEKARHHHTEKQYGQAKEHYEKAADLHKSTTRWDYLSPNYLAWAKLEEGEDLSRREQTEEAKDLFQKAAKAFAEAKKSIQSKLEKIENRDEKELLVNLAEASDIREEYCLGRIALEEARILDKQGDHAASSKKYGSATEKFQKATDAMKDESDRQELKPIVCLCRAWQTMTRAEAEASPDLYKEASRLFEEAKDHSLDEKAKMLALGHSSFCKALEAGTRFEAVRDTSLHTLATQHLEGAASYYLRAGFKNASEYAEATQKLLDAYLYMHNAKTQTDPTKKAQFYMMAEKVLQASAGSYLKAKHPEKQEQVSTLLEKVKNERELALSLTEVLHAPLATSTTATFTTPSSTEETPTGLERFDHADIQANIITRQKELKVGENLNLKVELVNAGKGPALLIKLAEVIPEGFELAEKPEVYRAEDSYLDMKGKRLDPLKTEEVRLVLKPNIQGVFPLKPRILYLDENGKARSYEPEPINITVKELGIKGWLKGER
jgi:tetratricopeptide (TPR) repeat protein